MSLGHTTWAALCWPLEEICCEGQAGYRADGRKISKPKRFNVIYVCFGHFSDAQRIRGTLTALLLDSAPIVES